MYVVTINEKWGHDLKENREGYTGRSEQRKGEKVSDVIIL